MLFESFHEQMTRLRKDMAFVRLGQTCIGFVQPELKVCRIGTVSETVAVTTAPADEFNRNASGRSFRRKDFGSKEIQRLCGCVICHR